MGTAWGFSSADRSLSATRRARQARAQRWFTEPDLVPVSAAYDQRVTPIFSATVVEAGLARLGRVPLRVLDVGCGRGNVLGLLARRLPGCELVGIDPSASAVAAARAALPDVSVLRAGAEELTRDLVEPVDLVLAHLTVGLWPDVVRGLAACLDSLAPGGLCYVLDLLRPADEQAAVPYLAPARDDEELSYLRDQMAVWYSADELPAIVALLCPPDGDLVPELVFSGFADVAAGALRTPAATLRFPPVAAGATKQIYHLLFRRKL